MAAMKEAKHPATLVVRLSDGLLAAIDAYARKRELGRSAAARLLILQALAHEKTRPRSPRTRTGRTAKRSKRR